MNPVIIKVKGPTTSNVTDRAKRVLSLNTASSLPNRSNQTPPVPFPLGTLPFSALRPSNVELVSDVSVCIVLSAADII